MGHSRIALSTRLKTACATLENTLKVRFLGIGFVWAWIYCSFETSALYPERQGISINADPSWLASATAVVVTFIVTGIAWRTRELERMRWAQFAAPALIATGTALSAVASFAEPPLVFLQYASGIMSGIGSGWLCILWADALSRLEIEQIEVVVPAASLVTLLCTLVFPYIEGIPGVIAVASLPLVSGVLLSMSYKKTARSERASCREDRKAPLDRTCLIAIVRASAMIGVAYFAIGCMSAMSASEDLLQAWWGFDVPTFIGSASGIAMALCFILFSMRIDFASLFRWLTPLLVLALALFPWQEVAPNFISTTITAIADTSMQVIAYLYVISLAKRRLVPIALGLGITQGSVQLGVLTGNLAGSRASQTRDRRNPQRFRDGAGGLSPFSRLQRCWCLNSARSRRRSFKRARTALRRRASNNGAASSPENAASPHARLRFWATWRKDAPSLISARSSFYRRTPWPPT